jgi:WhiB family transcriptional regulator, redox-sensing transcriptional regulator
MADVRRLPVPVAELWEWQLRGACRNLDNELFFHPERERGPARAERETRAKMICRVCPVIAECRAHALRADEPYGVWGGLSATERRELLGARRFPAQ